MSRRDGVFGLVTLSALVFLAGWTACTSATSPPNDGVVQEYIFLGHPYDWQAENRVDPRLELLDYSRYDGVWLGGDVCARTSKDAATLSYLDSLFDLKDDDTAWAWGNHDLMEGDRVRLLAATGKPDYYTYRRGGLQIIVLNTNLFWYYDWPPPQEDCARKAAQTQWLKRVLDTLATASHLVILHHHGLFNEFKRDARGATPRPDNLTGIPIRPDCRAAGDLTREIYPRLQRLRAAGTRVVCIVGDVGMRDKGYTFRTPHGVELLGSGINNSLDRDYPPDYVTNLNPDSVLIVRYAPEPDTLTWQFVRLSDLVDRHLGDAGRAGLPRRVRTLLERY